MNVNFGLFPPVSIEKPEGHVGRWKATEKTIAKREAITARALNDIAAWA
jgi:methylenetetrahydrofolate--tRNA-(uracil-5-)-methyltransferase